ncbi:MAG TPA: hypothetical protein VMJ64_00240, partial [Anaerolineales bacterium]|nr:hypothetical protein [Anaerolineales bacterium]
DACPATSNERASANERAPSDPKASEADPYPAWPPLRPDEDVKATVNPSETGLDPAVGSHCCTWPIVSGCKV